MAPTTAMHFYKIMMGDFSDRLRIPPAFVKYISNGGSVKEARAVLVGPSGSVWKVMLRRLSRKDLYIENGWRDFVKDHSLHEYDYLLFRYDGNMRFKVKIYDKTACEREDSFNVKRSFVHEAPQERKKRARTENCSPVSSDLTLDNSNETNTAPDGKAHCSAQAKNIVSDRKVECSAQGKNIVSHGKVQSSAQGKKIVPDGKAQSSVQGKNIVPDGKVQCLAQSKNIVLDGKGQCSAQGKNIVPDGKVQCLAQSKNIVLDGKGQCSAQVVQSRKSKANEKLITANIIHIKDEDEDEIDCDEDDRDEVAAENFRSFTSKNPFFSVEMKGNNVLNRVVAVPLPFRDHLPNHTVWVDFLDPEGRMVKVKYICSGFSKVFSAGFSSFVRNNNINVGDLCIFELVDDLKVKVHIFRPYKQLAIEVYNRKN